MPDTNTVDANTAEIDALLQRGLSLHHTGLLEQAECIYNDVLHLRPNDPQAMHALGLLAHQTGRESLAVSYLQATIAAVPDEPMFRHNLGKVLCHQERFHEAIESYRVALGLNIRVPDTHHDLGTAYAALGEHEAAMKCFREALRQRPDYPEAANNLGLALLNRQGSPEVVAAAVKEATDWFRITIRQRPDFVEALNNFGHALARQGLAEEAVAYFRQAIRLRPRYLNARNNLGLALAELAQFKESSFCYEELFKLGDDGPDAHYNYGVTLLALGELRQGWQEYEWRRLLPMFPQRRFAQPDWEGDKLDGRILLITAEQGLGDTIQFFRFIAELPDSEQIIVEVQQPLFRLLAASLPGVPWSVRVVAAGEPLPSFDLHCPMMSLPRLLSATLETIPAHTPYVHVPPAAIDLWAERLSGLKGLRVGLVWAGNPDYPNDRRRSIHLSLLAPILRMDGVAFVSLQKGAAAGDVEACEGVGTIHDWTEELDDFADTAALIGALDLVISVDTAVVHLAGAMGKPVWLLNRYGTCWRWLIERVDSPWYPSLRQFRQPEADDWESVLYDLEAALRQVLAGEVVLPAIPDMLDPEET